MQFKNKICNLYWIQEGPQYGSWPWFQISDKQYQIDFQGTQYDINPIIPANIGADIANMDPILPVLILKFMADPDTDLEI